MTTASPRDRRLGPDVTAILLLTAIIFVLFADLLFSGNALLGRDIVLYHYGMKKVVRDLLLHGDFPYWNRLFTAGQPLAANPAYEVFYPLQLFILLPSFRFGFNFHIVVHVLLVAVGMYLLLRQLQLGRPAAFFGAASFALGGMITSLTGLLPFLFSVAWMPWVFLFAVRWFVLRRPRDLALAGMAMSMQAIIGEPLTMAQTCGLLAFAAVWFGTERGSAREAVRCLMATASVVAIALCIAAVQLLPALDFTRDSVRSLPFGLAAVSTWSLPLLRPLELFFPKWAGPMAGEGNSYFGGRLLYGGVAIPFIYSIYLGLLISVAAVAGFVRRVRGWKPALIVVVVSYVLAVGHHTPLLRLLYATHLFSSVRYPEKFIIGAIFTIALFGAFVVQRVLDEGDELLRRTAVAVAALAAGLAAAVFAVSLLPGYESTFAAVWRLGGSRLVPEFASIARQDWALSAVRAGALAAILVFMRRLERRAALGVLFVFVLADVVPQSQEAIAGRSRDYLDPPPLLERLRGDGTERIFNQAAIERLSVNRARMTRTEQYWVSRNGLYPFLSGYFGRATVMEYDIDATSLLNVRMFNELARAALVGGYPAWPGLYMQVTNARFRLMPLNEREEFARAPSLDVAPVVRVEDGPPSQRYWFASRLVHIASPIDLDVIGRAGPVPAGTAFVPLRSAIPRQGSVRHVVERPNDAVVDVTADGVSFLVASVTNHRYWTASIDGKPAPIVPTNVCFQGVIVPPGRHTIVFMYRNPLIRVGAIISMATLLMGTLFVFVDERRRK